MLATGMKGAPADTTGAINDTAAVVAISDTTTTDTSNYVISTTIPRGFMQTFRDAVNEASDETSVAFRLFDGLGFLFAAGGIVLVLFLVGILLLPLLLVVLVVWLLVRNSRRAREADMRRRQSYVTPNNANATDNADGGAENNGMARPAHDRYLNRRDNAFLNIAIGAGLLVMFAILDFRLGMGIGALIAIWGLGGLAIAYNHRNKDEQ